MKTYTARAADIKHNWHLIDATGKNLGRLASEIARLKARFVIKDADTSLKGAA